VTVCSQRFRSTVGGYILHVIICINNECVESFRESFERSATKNVLKKSRARARTKKMTSVVFDQGFGANATKRKYRILELTPTNDDNDLTTLLQQSPSGSQTTPLTDKWFIKESHNSADGSVLCTAKSTYRMKQVETSNSLCLIATSIDTSSPSSAMTPSQSTDKNISVLTVLSCYYECLPTIAVVQKAQERLIDAGRIGVPFTKLSRTVPASERELRLALSRMHAVKQQVSRSFVE
jgi:hypothetical protein